MRGRQSGGVAKKSAANTLSPSQPSASSGTCDGSDLSESLHNECEREREKEKEIERERAREREREREKEKERERRERAERNLFTSVNETVKSTALTVQKILF